MQAVLSLTEKEINTQLLSVIKSLFDKNVSEIVIKNSEIRFEEFDSSVPISDIVKEMSSYGYSEDFLCEIKDGLEQSSLYKK